MTALFIQRPLIRKVTDDIAMFANHGPAIALCGPHGYVVAGKGAVHLEVHRLKRPDNGIARKGNGANEYTARHLSDDAPKGVGTFRKGFGCFHPIIFRRSVVNRFTGAIIPSCRLTCERCHGIGPAKLRLLVDKTARFFLGCVSCRKGAFKTDSSVCFGHLVVHGERPHPLPVFHSRENVDDAASVFELFHLPLKAVAGKELSRRFDDDLIKETLRFAKIRHYPSEVVSNHQEMSGEQG